MNAHGNIRKHTAEQGIAGEVALKSMRKLEVEDSSRWVTSEKVLAQQRPEGRV